MPVKLRLQRHGRSKRPFYYIVIADSRSPRDGKFIEKLGTYNPTTVPATIDIDRDKAFDWLQKGAQPTDTVRAILSYKGVLYRKHLQKGVSKGAMTQEQADNLYQEFIAKKEGRIDEHRARIARKEEEERLRKLEQEKKVRESREAVAAPAEEESVNSDEVAGESGEEISAEAEVSTETAAEEAAPSQEEEPKAE